MLTVTQRKHESTKKNKLGKNMRILRNAKSKPTLASMTSMIFSTKFIK